MNPPAAQNAEPRRSPSDVSGRKSLHEQGCRLVNNLCVLIKSSLLFDLDNEVLSRPMADLLGAIDQVARTGEPPVGVRVLDDVIAVSGVVLKADRTTFENGRFLNRVFISVDALEISFEEGFDQDDLVALLAALKEVLNGGDASEDLAAVAHVTLTPRGDRELVAGDEGPVDPRVQVLRVYAASVAVMSDVMWRASYGMQWSPRLVRRVAYDLADATLAEPDLALGLLHVPVGEHRLAAHLVRVATLSLLCANRLELARRARPEAALVALFHHLPLMARHVEDGELPAEPARAEALAENPGDPLDTALALCARSGINDATMRRVVAVYEAGGAAVERRDLYHDSDPGDLLARIVAVADRYDNLFREMPPDEALRVIFVEQRERDPIVARLFVNAVGVYPVGTMVRLSSDAFAVVVEVPQQRANLTRPVVRIIDGPDSGSLVDLADESQRHGEISNTVDAAQVGTNVSRLFLL